jgi:hypothetical protein
VRWLPGDESVLVGHWNGLWEIGLDGTAARAPYPVRRGVYDVFGIDPEGPVHQNDWRRSTLVTWDGAEAVREVPFVQCERLVAAHALLGAPEVEEGGVLGPRRADLDVAAHGSMASGATCSGGTACACAGGPRGASRKR